MNYDMNGLIKPQELVSRLQAEIEQKNTELQTLTSNVTTIQTTIQKQWVKTMMGMIVGIAHWVKKSIPYLSNIHRQADRQKFSTYLLQAHEVRGYTVFSYATNTGDKIGRYNCVVSSSVGGGGGTDPELPDVTSHHLCAQSR